VVGIIDLIVVEGDGDVVPFTVSECTNLVIESGAPLDATDGPNAKDLSTNPGSFYNINGAGAEYQSYSVELLDMHAVAGHYGLMEVQLFTLNQVSTGADFVDTSTLAANSMLDMERPDASCSHLPDGSTSGVHQIDYGLWSGNVYCDMVTQGGGWTMLMKAKQGNTFHFDSDHWTVATTLNVESTNRDNGDAKFAPFNSMPVSAFLAIWPEDGE
jgi:hypothetical protein